MSELLLNRTRDRPPTPVEVAEDIRSLHYAHGGAFAASFNRDIGLWLTFVVAFCDRDDSFSANRFSGAQAELEWWQRDHVLTGLAFATLEPDSNWEALACAQRGKLEDARICVWFDRGSLPKLITHYEFYRRAPRRRDNFRPQGPPLSVRDVRQLLEKGIPS